MNDPLFQCRNDRRLRFENCLPPIRSALSSMAAVHLSYHLFCIRFLTTDDYRQSNLNGSWNRATAVRQTPLHDSSWDEEDCIQSRVLSLTLPYIGRSWP